LSKLQQDKVMTYWVTV